MNTAEMFKNLPMLNVNKAVRKNRYKILNLTHTDADGYMPVAVLKYCFGNDSADDLHFGHGAGEAQRVQEVLLNAETWSVYDFVIMTDYNISMDLAEKVQKTGNATKFVILDHHESAKSLNKYGFACVSKETPSDSFLYDWNKKVASGRYAAGTSLLVDYLKYIFDCQGQNLRWWEVEPLAERVSGYDNWDWHRLFDDDARYQIWSKIFWTIGGDAFVGYYRLKSIWRGDGE